MNIIKHGEYYDCILFGKCTNCKCEFKCSKMEAQETKTSFITNCPECSRPVKLDQIKS